jgi:hypothetical protein
VHINLPPTPRENLNHKRVSRPILLVEEHSLVIAGVFLIHTHACIQIPQDSRCIDLSHLSQIYKLIYNTYLKYHKQLRQQVSIFGAYIITFNIKLTVSIIDRSYNN